MAWLFWIPLISATLLQIPGVFLILRTIERHSHPNFNPFTNTGVIYPSITVRECWCENADALRCYSCYYDTSLNKTSCETTSENCTANLKFCVTQSEERYDGSKEFKRSCVPAVVCEPDYCEENVIQLLGRKSCNITCCQENFCNRDDYIPPVGSGHVSYVHWLFGHACLIVAIWFLLFGSS